MGTKTKIVVVVVCFFAGYILGRSDGQDIESNKNALIKISALESDNQHLYEQINKLKSQAVSSTAALNARTKEVDNLKRQQRLKKKDIEDVSQKNSDWSNTAVPSDVARVLRTSNDD